jgi:hypothetical protein
MKKSEAKALLKSLEGRLKYIRELKKKWRRLEAEYLTHCLPKDIAPPEKMHFGSNFIEYRKYGMEEQFLVAEIKSLRDALTKS